MQLEVMKRVVSIFGTTTTQMQRWDKLAHGLNRQPQSTAHVPHPVGGKEGLAGQIAGHVVADCVVWAGQPVQQNAVDMTTVADQH